MPDGGTLPAVKVLLFGMAAHKSACCEACSISPFLQVSAERKLTGLRILFIGSSLCVLWASCIAK